MSVFHRTNTYLFEMVNDVHCILQTRNVQGEILKSYASDHVSVSALPKQECKNEWYLVTYTERFKANRTSEKCCKRKERALPSYHRLRYARYELTHGTLRNDTGRGETPVV